MRSYIGGICVMIVVLFACREPFIAPAIENSVSYLVVDGFINTGEGATSIRLSRTRNISDTSASPELNARVIILGENSNAYLLTESGNGIYSANLSLKDYSIRYQVEILTAAGKNYLSDFVTPKQTPAIDSIYWQFDESGVRFFLDTHDAGNNTGYYRWNYTATWDRRAQQPSGLKYENGQMLVRGPDEQVYQCWPSDSGSTIEIATSSKLERDVINQQPIAFVPMGSEQMRFLYSVIVYQYAIDEKAFDYWINVKKNSEQLGTLFDPQPSQTIGNIHCVEDPGEPVLGYMTASSVTSKRIFVHNNDLPYWYYYPPIVCNELLDVSAGQWPSFFSDTTLFVPVSGGGVGGAGQVFAISVECGDCRYDGAPNKKPSYWP